MRNNNYLGCLLICLVSIAMMQSCTTTKKSGMAPTQSKVKETFALIGENDTMKLPGLWVYSSANKLTNQYFYRNADSIVISLTKNPVKKFPFYKVAMDDSLFVEDYYKWESDHYKEMGYAVNKIDASKNRDYIVWTVDDKQNKVSLLYGVKNDKAYGLSMIEPKNLKIKSQIAFLIQVFKDN
ncbi:MAG TPA: hypothetical protein PLY70_03835 [Saprospiraceae bacterium]|nr:hypothetical protein [Saprospiraceae bacterium]